MPPYRPYTCRYAQWGVAVCVILAAALQTFAAENDDLFSVRAEGYAEGVGPTVRAAAIADAQRQVIEQVIKSLVTINDMGPLRSILRNASAYIQRYDIIRQDQSGDAMRVEIDAFVLEKPLRQDVAATLFPRLPHPPKIQLLIGEKLPNDEIVAVPDAGLAETVLRDGLNKLKLETAGSETLEKTFSQKKLIEIVTGGVDAGQRFTLANQADAVAVGTAIVALEGNQAGNNVLRCRAVVTLNVFRGYDGKMMDSLTAAAVVSSMNPADGADQAVRDACTKLVHDAAVTAILAVLSSQASDAVVITIERPSERIRIDELITRLEMELHLENIEELYYSEDRARIRVPYDGPIAHLVDILTQVKYAGKSLQPSRVVGRDMSLEFK